LAGEHEAAEGVAAAAHEQFELAAFHRYDQALLGIIGINQNAFSAAVADGRSALDVWAWLPYAVGVAVLVLVGVALYPRLREYR
jgi:hypothetical protein